MGLEPIRLYSQRILSPLCLPISSLDHLKVLFQRTYLLYNNNSTIQSFLITF